MLPEVFVYVGHGGVALSLGRALSAIVVPLGAAQRIVLVALYVPEYAFTASAMPALVALHSSRAPSGWATARIPVRSALRSRTTMGLAGAATHLPSSPTWWDRTG